MANRKQRPIMNFQGYTILEFIDLVKVVVLNMTGNIYFLNPIPSLASLSAKADALALLELTAKSGTTADTKNMLDTRAVLEEEMLKLGMYIYLAAEGDLTKMLSTLFPLTSGTRAPAKRPLLQLKQCSESGVVEAKCKAMINSKAYIWMYFVGENRPENEDDWKFSEGTTRVKKTFRKLQPRTKVWVRVCGVTHEGMTPWVSPDYIVVV